MIFVVGAKLKKMWNTLHGPALNTDFKAPRVALSDTAEELEKKHTREQKNIKLFDSAGDPLKMKTPKPLTGDFFRAAYYKGPA